MNYFCCRSFRIYKQNLARIRFRQSSFQIGSYSEIYQENFRKTTSKKSIFKVGSFESINKILEKYLRKNLYFRKLFCIYEQSLWNTPVREFFFQFIIPLVIFVIVLNAPLLKCLTSASVKNLLETPCLIIKCIMKTKSFLFYYIFILIYIYIV